MGRIKKVNFFDVCFYRFPINWFVKKSSIGSRPKKIQQYSRSKISSHINFPKTFFRLEGSGDKKGPASLMFFQILEQKPASEAMANKNSFIGKIIFIRL